MTEELRAEVESQITATRLSIIKEVRSYLKCFYLSFFGMICCLFIGFYIGNSQSESTKNMIFNTQKKVDLVMKKLGIEYKN